MPQAETDRLSQLVLSAALSRAICTVAELGVADQIVKGAPQPIASLAESTGAHERSLYRVMRFLASRGLFVETDDRRFDHTPLSACLSSDADDSFRPAARMFHRLFPAWDGLHHAVMTGESGFKKVFGQEIFEYMPGHPELPAIFDAGMTALHGFETNAMLEAYDFHGIEILADIGGGNGSLITAVMKRYPKLKGILFDLDHVVARARANLAQAGLGDRCTLVEGSFFESIPEGADAYLLRHIIHDWTDEQSIQILQNCRKAVPDHGRVLIVECVVPAGNEPSAAKDLDMCMLTIPGGIERTEQEYGALFERSGFRLAKVTPTASSISVIDGRPV